MSTEARSEPRQKVRYKEISVNPLTTYKLIKIRKFWLVFMFALGVLTQYSIAFYFPNIWTYTFQLVSRVLPVLS